MHSFVELIALLDLTGLALTVARSYATLAPKLTPQLLHSCFAAPCALASSRLLRSLIIAPPSAPQQPFVRHSPIQPRLELTLTPTTLLISLIISTILSISTTITLTLLIFLAIPITLSLLISRR